jgi:bifunctional non-homologous end joining protein LigD
MSSASFQLTQYRAKRDFKQTREPSGAKSRRATGQSYLVQKHAASRLHFDFRLELDGVLKSWAVTKGPSLSPEDKRLAVHVEDHPLDYGSFEGTIPQGQYGGGTVMLWDEGTWEPLGNPERDLKRGNLTFNLHGKRLKGRWHLVRLRGKRPGDAKRENWLLIKGKDEFADKRGDAAIEKYQKSVVSDRTMEAIAHGSGRSWGKVGARKKSAAEAEDAVKALHKKASREPRAIKPTKLPSGGKPAVFIPPQLATLVPAPPRGDNWVHEIKFDGYRLVAVLNRRDIKIFTRAANDWSHRFKPLCAALAKLKVANAVIDGEVVHVEENGSFSFHGLQNALSTGKLDRLQYYAFDLLHLDGIDLRDRPLTDRKALLEKILINPPPLLAYSEHFVQPGNEVFERACDLALEGIVSKRANAPYQSGRNDAWLKSKCIKEQELVIGGYTEQPKHPGTLGALLIGTFEGERLRFAGKVGTGFTHAEGRDLMKKLQARAAVASPFLALDTASRRGAHFVKPELVAQVHFSEWTPDGRLRHPSFQGLREDKPAKEVVREKEKSLMAVPEAITTPRTKTSKSLSKDKATAAHVRITHPDRVLWQDVGITKLELAGYYAAIAPRLLAQSGRRPISLVRCPNGPTGQCFFQRHVTDGMSSHVHGVKVAGHGEGKAYIYVDDAEGLVSLIQMGTIEFHAWGATVDAVKTPDRLIFDLDPAPDVAWSEVKQAALDVRSNLKSAGLVALLKTTGGKGLHVVVPFARGPGWSEAKGYARSFSEAMAKNEPDRFTINNRKDVRKGRIFIDYLRNDETASAVAAYSVRTRPGAPVSVPIDWKELKDLKSGSAFSIKETLMRRADPWKDIEKIGRQKLPLPGKSSISRTQAIAKK